MSLYSPLDSSFYLIYPNLQASLLPFFISVQDLYGMVLGFSGRGRRKVSITFHRRPETCRLCRGCEYNCPRMVVSCQGIKEPGELCGRGVCIEELPTCCLMGTFGWFCNQNLL